MDKSVIVVLTAACVLLAPVVLFGFYEAFKIVMKNAANTRKKAEDV